jgi:hypothetical protein
MLTLLAVVVLVIMVGTTWGVFRIWKQVKALQLENNLLMAEIAKLRLRPRRPG